MSSLSTRILVLAAGLAFAVAAAAPAEANKAKHHHKKAAATHHSKTHRARQASRCRGGNLFACGPVYQGNDYLGDDPDPFIRLQLMRDLGAHYGDVM